MTYINFESDFKAYTRSLEAALETVSEIEIIKAVDLIRDTIRRGKMIYVCGNGGSASIAETISAVWMKWVNQHTTDEFRAKVISLAGNASLTTAISNDFGYEDVFAYQLSCLLEPGDLVVTISSSGNSPNIASVINTCEAYGNDCIAFSGFDGGISKLATVNLHVDNYEYCLVEDAHHALAHYICRNIIFLENN